jgi:cytochrome oxidase Cu insertion factor (SCO1/SenC/PrrC family)
MDVLMWNREPVDGPFTLIDHTGQRRTDTDFRGKLMLVYFGFTYCPDVRPTDLQEMSLAVEKLGAQGEAIQPLFITVDPERDTPEHLADYVSLFHPRLVALTGEPSAHPAGGTGVQGVLHEGADLEGRLYGRSQRLCVPHGTGWRVSRLFPARDLG